MVSVNKGGMAKDTWNDGAMRPIFDSEQEVVNYIKNNLPGDASRREYGGYIYAIDGGYSEYSYTQGRKIWSEGALIKANTGPRPRSAVAGWHNHPTGGGERFSEDVENNEKFYRTNRGDAAWIKEKNLPAYLITPTKRVLYLTPSELRGPVETRHFPWPVYFRK